MKAFWIKSGLSAFVLGFASCSPRIVYDPSPFSLGNVTDSISLPVEYHMFPGKYYRVKFDSVSEKFENMAYMGSRDGFNIFAVYSKMPGPESVTRIALVDSQCRVEDKRAFALEYAAYMGGFRHALDWKGTCVVFGDSITRRFGRGFKGPYSREEWYSRWEEAVGQERDSSQKN